MTRRNTQAALLLASWALFGSGCSQESEDGGNGRSVIPVVPHPESPMSYTLEDPSCQDAVDPVSIAATQIYAWDGDEVITKDVTLAGIRSSKNSLVSSTIKETTYSDQFERICDLSLGTDRACDDEDGQEKTWLRNNKTSGGFLRVCQSAHNYGRQSYEGVALTSAYYIEKANSRYMQLADGAAPLPQITLSVLPAFITYYDNYLRDGERKRLETYITHNLAYFQGGQMIAVFPENVVKGKDAKGYFWESEFVLGHEYGHHIDWSRHGATLQSLGLRWNALTHSFVDEVALAGGQGAISGRGQIAGAVAEAFADLLAYYSEGATSRSLMGLAELGEDRDVASPKFAQGYDKILTDENLEQLVAGDDAMTGESGAPNFADIHIGGAVVAASLDAMFKTLVETDPAIGDNSEDSIRRRYQLTLAWMDAFTKGLKTLGDGPAEAHLTDPISDAIETAVDGYLVRFPLSGDPAGEAMRAEVCRQAKVALPGVRKVPFAGC